MIMITKKNYYNNSNNKLLQDNINYNNFKLLKMQ